MNPLDSHPLADVPRPPRHRFGWKTWPGVSCPRAGGDELAVGASRHDELLDRDFVEPGVDAVADDQREHAEHQVSQQYGWWTAWPATIRCWSSRNTSTTSDITDVQLTLNDPESVIEALKVLSPDGIPPVLREQHLWRTRDQIDISLPTPWPRAKRCCGQWIGADQRIHEYRLDSRLSITSCSPAAIRFPARMPPSGDL